MRLRLAASSNQATQPTTPEVIHSSPSLTRSGTETTADGIVSFGRATWRIDSWRPRTQRYGSRINDDLPLRHWSLAFSFAILASLPWLGRFCRYAVSVFALC